MEDDKAKAWCTKNGDIPYIETCATQNQKVEDVFRQMAETQAAKSAAGAGSFDMPTSLGGASGAMTLSANDDAKRTEDKAVQKKKKKCC